MIKILFLATNILISANTFATKTGCFCHYSLHDNSYVDPFNGYRINPDPLDEHCKPTCYNNFDYDCNQYKKVPNFIVFPEKSRRFCALENHNKKFIGYSKTGQGDFIPTGRICGKVNIVYKVEYSCKSPFVLFDTDKCVYKTGILSYADVYLNSKITTDGKQFFVITKPSTDKKVSIVSCTII